MLLAAPGAFAQIEDGSFLTSDVTFTDLDGTTHSVYEYLDEGKTVVLDLFAEWCGPCWDYHQTNALKTLHNTYGPDGTDELIVIAVETDGSTPESSLTGGAGSTYGWDWTDGTPYPLANANIGGIFQQGYYPYIIRICPNRQIYELGQSSANAIYSQINNCGVASGNVNPALVGYTGETSVGCEGGEVGVSVMIQNMGMDNLTSATIEVSEGGESLLEYEWSGNLTTYGFQEVDLGDVEILEPVNIEVAITSTDEVGGDNELEQLIGFPGAVGTEIEVHFYTDNYPSESSWELRNSMSQVVASGGPYQPGNGDQWGAGGPDALTTKVHDVTLPNVDDCYSVRVYDEYGDGLQFGTNPAGFFGLEIFFEGESVAVIELGDFGSMVNIGDVITTQGAVGIEDIMLDEELSVFPNPVVNNVTIQTSLNESAKVTIEVFDLTGKIVYAEDLGTQPAGEFIRQIDFNNVSNGMYLLQMYVGEASVTRKLSVNK